MTDPIRAAIEAQDDLAIADALIAQGRKRLPLDDHQAVLSWAEATIQGARGEIGPLERRLPKMEAATTYVGLGRLVEAAAYACC